MRQTSIKGNTLTYPDAWAFMFSPMPVIYKYTGTDTVPDSVIVRVTSSDTGRTFSETRQVGPSSSARFDISRICQELAPELDTLADGIQSPDALGGGAFNPCASFSLTVVAVTGSQWTTVLLAMSFYARYGACDPGESWQNHGVRLRANVTYYVNFPQTVTVYAGATGRAAILSPDGRETHEFEQCPNCAEIYPAKVFAAKEWSDYAAGLEAGAVDLRTFGQFCKDGAFEGRRVTIKIHLETDNTPADAPGRFFLRWLNRHGEFRYRLFYGGDFKTTISESESFTRLQGYDDYTPTDGRSYANPDKANFATSRTLVLGAPGVTAEEFDELTELAASPLVHLYRHSGESEALSRWIRVNVQAGSYRRSRRRETPQRLNFEIGITLPPQNTPRL